MPLNLTTAIHIERYLRKPEPIHASSPVLQEVLARTWLQSHIVAIREDADAGIIRASHL